MLQNSARVACANPTHNGVAKSIIGGGGYIHIVVFKHGLSKQLVSREINSTEHEYMNMPLPTLFALVY